MTNDDQIRVFALRESLQETMTQLEALDRKPELDESDKIINRQLILRYSTLRDEIGELENSF